MKFEDFKMSTIFYTAAGKWIVIGISSDSHDGNGYPTPVVFALPLKPNTILNNNSFNNLITEFYEWNFGECELSSDKFNKN